MAVRSHSQVVAVARSGKGIAIGLLALMLTAESARAQSLEKDSVATRNQPKPFCCSSKHIGMAAAEIGILQIMPWYFNRHINDDTTAVLSFSSLKRNIAQGFEWDPNEFVTNMFMHPIHGNVFYNSARSNGYNYYESSAFAWAGSFIWEFFFENNRPAINDWAMTSLGGIAIGEALNRTARMIRDNRATGTGRAARELAGLLLDPIGAGNRLVRGEMTRVGENPDDRLPDVVTIFGAAGYRFMGEGTFEQGRSTGYAEVDVQYGSPFDDYRRPFDSFRLNAQLNMSDKETLGRLQIEGVLHGLELKNTPKAKHIFGVTQHFDYINNLSFETGGQSVSAGLLSRFHLPKGWMLQTRLQMSGLIIWAVNSEVAAITGRDYDFGSGLGVRTGGRLSRSGTNLIGASYEGYWSHTLNGGAGNHFTHHLTLEGWLPLKGRIGAGVKYVLFIRKSLYRDVPNVLRRNPQIRFFTAFRLRYGNR